MYNTTKILQGLLEKSNVEVDTDLEIAGVEIEDKEFYLYAYINIEEDGFEFDFFFAPNVQPLTKIELKPKHEELISDFLKNAYDKKIEEKEEMEEAERILEQEAEERNANPYAFFGVSRTDFI